MVGKGKNRSRPLIEDYHLLSYESLDSTNSEARRIAEGGGAHGAFIWARQQTNGRGRLDRNWISHDGNLFVSILLSPGNALAELPQLSFVAACAAAESIRPLMPEGSKVECKWPNDILINNRKVGGILLESFETRDGDAVCRWAVVGVGLNIDSCPEKTDFPATFLKDEGVELVSAKIVLSRFIHHFIIDYQRWQDEGFEPLRQQWLKQAWKLKKKLAVKQGESKLKGTFTGLDLQGGMELETTPGQKQIITSGDVLA